MKISVRDALSYREPLRVTEIILLLNGDRFPVCPRCKVTLEREYQSYCDRCGQRLNWDDFENAEVVEFEQHTTIQQEQNSLCV